MRSGFAHLQQMMCRLRYRETERGSQMLSLLERAETTLNIKGFSFGKKKL
jgi:hypothetical protein